MTPADCQHAVATFTAAYRAVQTQRGGLIAMPDGTDRRLPSAERISPMPAGAGQVAWIDVLTRERAQIGPSAHWLARAVAQHAVLTGNAAFFRVPPRTGVSVVSEADALPCRATLIEPHRQEMRIEVAVRV